MKIAGKILDLGSIEVVTDIPEHLNLKPGDCHVYILKKLFVQRLLIIRMDAKGRVRSTYKKLQKPK